jgi:hypothetical protein
MGFKKKLNLLVNVFEAKGDMRLEFNGIWSDEIETDPRWCSCPFCRDLLDN